MALFERAKVAKKYVPRKKKANATKKLYSTSEQTPISRKNTKQKETGFFMFFPKIFQTKPHKMQKQADKTQKKQHHSDSNQKYIAETQYFA
ncbi:MAG: hypothetical protein IKN78_10705 [Bacteroidales bacterium]|nr:hypothetical protein [Bacteroidales bacterium]